VEVKIRWGVEDSERIRVAEVFYDSLSDKLAPVFGGRTKAIPCIANALIPERVVLAIEDASIAGAAGLAFDDLGFLNTSIRNLTRCLGLGVFRAIFNGWLLETKVSSNELYIDALAVTKEARGRGVGSRMLASIRDFANSQNIEQLKLSVIDRNTRAIKFYKRNGFEEYDVQTLPYPWNRTFGFSRSVEMVLEI
jgi:ribosomal protein S18 acetylase RimI-like enzyme